jgi:hypothetical protein
MELLAIRPATISGLGQGTNRTGIGACTTKPAGRQPRPTNDTTTAGIRGIRARSEKYMSDPARPGERARAKLGA